MDDKFLYQLQEQPDPEFAKSLLGKLVQLRSEPDGKPDVNMHNLKLNKKLIRFPVLLVLAAITVMAISPARASVSSLITNIAGQLFEMTNDYPGDNDSGEVEIIEAQVMPFTAVLAIYPYAIKMPTAIPSDCILDEDHVMVYVGEGTGPFENSIEFLWSSSTRGCFSLRITEKKYWGNGEIVAPDTVEAIALNNDITAVLIRGGWDADIKFWNSESPLRLRWPVGDLMYELVGIDQEELIEIATSTLK